MSKDTIHDFSFANENYVPDNVEKLGEKDDDDVKRLREETIKDNVVQVNYFQVFRYSTNFEKFLILLAIICSAGAGLGLPINFVIFSGLIDQSVDSSASANVTQISASDIEEQIWPYIRSFIILGCCIFFANFVQAILWMYTSTRQVSRIRQNLVHSMQHQNSAWYDANPPGTLVNKINDSVDIIEQGIGDKAAIFVQYMTTFIVGFIISFVKGWRLSLVALSILPILVIAIMGIRFITKTYILRELKAYEQASGIAAEILTAIRTVYVYGKEKLEALNYLKNLKGAMKESFTRAVLMAVFLSLIPAAVNGSASLVFWYGAKIIREENFSSGGVIQIFFCLIMGFFSLGNAMPSMEFFANAVATANDLFGIIERKPVIDRRKTGRVPASHLRGEIELRNVTFTYPTREGQKILKNFNLKIEAGQSVALVGPSGSGKSTIVQLVQRLYDPDYGQVLIDGMDLREMDLTWLRKQIRVVQQEPALFLGSVKQNILFGSEASSQADLEFASKQANAHVFVDAFPDKYDTNVGEDGHLLSGGQKQRVAIARALIVKPKILLLDEATSALDNQSEKIVQAAIEKITETNDFTTIMIAHRLSTVTKADKIVVLNGDGTGIREAGSHSELMKSGGWYSKMVQEQEKANTVESTTANNSFYQDNQFDKNFNEMAEDELEFGEVGDFGDDVVSFKSGSKWSPGRNPVMRPLKSLKLQFRYTVRMLKLNLPEIPVILLACICCMAVGCAQPVFSLLVTEMIRVFTLKNNPSQMATDAVTVALYLMGLAIVNYVCNFGKTFFFGWTGIKLTYRIREILIKSILRQEIGWFDRTENDVSNLMSLLAKDSNQVQGLSGPRLGLISEILAIIIFSLIVAFINSWKLALVVLAFMPLMMVAGINQGKSVTGENQSGIKHSKRSQKFDHLDLSTYSIISNNRLLKSLVVEDTVTEFYHKNHEKRFKWNVKTVGRLIMLGLTTGIGGSAFLFTYAAAFGYGAKLVASRELSFVDVFKVFTVITFGGAAIGRAIAFAPDGMLAFRSARKIFGIEDRQPHRVNRRDPRALALHEPMTTITVNSVHFNYPTRPDTRVLKNFNLSIPPGSRVAIVGGSGSGKSSLLQLLPRFYAPISGEIQLSGQNLQDLDVDQLRSRCAYVQQEPPLFNRTIRENISYGLLADSLDSQSETIMQRVQAAAKIACAHDFITSLPDGYETLAGPRGSLLSGGQKQRVALARAFVAVSEGRRILLLDEATSALDVESEAQIQENLTHLGVDSGSPVTVITVAHRLSTIKSADQIFVVKAGSVVEQGTHSSLMALPQGEYANLYQTSD